MREDGIFSARLSAATPTHKKSVLTHIFNALRSLATVENERFWLNAYKTAIPTMRTLARGAYQHR